MKATLTLLAISLALALAALSRTPVASRPESRLAAPRASRVNVARPTGQRDRLFQAICQVESGNNPNAKGDGGKAIGIVQIHPIMVRDCNRLVGYERYTLADRLSPSHSREMFNVWRDHYCRGASDEIVARRWNQGVGGKLNAASARYWIRVQKALASQ